MKPEVIPLELAIPEDAAVPKFAAPDIYRLLATKVIRGYVLCGSLFLILAAASGVAFVARQIPVGIASVVLAVVFGVCAHLLQRKLNLARRISVEPAMVYWAHPTILRQQVIGGAIDTTFITLHSRYGSSFEVGMSRDEMIAVVAWLRAHNPDIRLGSYDKTSSSAYNRNA